MRKTAPILLALLPFFLMTSCRGDENASRDIPEKIRLADQYGLAYAPVMAARSQGWFEEELPGAELEWATLGNASAIREAMLAGRLDGGCMGIPPYLIGRDRGMEWTAVEAVSEATLGLAAMNGDIPDIGSIPGDMRIAVPQPGSIQHILLSMAADRELGDAGRFDDQLVTLSHPDGMNALLSGGDVDAHFTSPPFLQRELESGASLVVDGDEAFGGRYTFIVAVLSDSFTENYPEAAEGVRRAIRRGAEWINGNNRAAAELLAPDFGMTADELETYFTSGTVRFEDGILGLDAFREFMAARGYLKNGA